jgi:hypothetical protein
VVIRADITAESRSATASLVRMSTGRRPQSGLSDHQTSPRATTLRVPLIVPLRRADGVHRVRPPP